MDSKAGREITLKEAQYVLTHKKFTVVCNHPEATKAIICLINALRCDGYQLIKLDKLINEIEEVAQKGIRLKQDEASIYMACLEDVTEIIKNCLQGGEDGKRQGTS